MTKIVEMKRFIKYITVFIVLLPLFSSCDEWLEATSNTQLPAEKLFETKSGFYNALTGVYIAMGNENAYGAAYTWKYNDMVAFPYVYQSISEYSVWQTHLYTGNVAQSTFSKIWQQSYNIIANINIILRELEAHRDVITYDAEYNMIKGELLALRAYLHFDLMKLFGVSEWSAENAGKLTVPYVTQYNKEPEIQRTYAETEELLLNDLNTAIQCLSIDPVTGNTPSDFESVANADGYWANRGKHMNYYAAKALLARVYQWKNDFENAAKEAQEVIDGALENEVVSWVDPEVLISATADNRDWTFSSEHLFSLEVTQLSDFMSGYMMSTNVTQAMLIPQEFVETLLFPVSDLAGTVDIRGQRMTLQYASSGYLSYKFYNSTNYVSAYRNRMPMIRFSEMYYILAESYIESGNDEEALNMLEEVRLHRGITDSYSADVNAEEELMKEYYREFIGEGQLFYYLKHRHITPNIWPEFTLSEANLIYLYPLDELSYGRVQEL